MVQLFGASFSPDELLVQEGDTVRWSWVSRHPQRRQRPALVADGLFDSGTPVASPHAFQITFDTAFLQANPIAVLGPAL